MTKRKSGLPPCTYCGITVDPDGSHAQNESTGEYCHIKCFMEHEPRGREIVERAKQRVIEELELAQGKRVVH
jgi:hypothetical protein